MNSSTIENLSIEELEKIPPRKLYAMAQQLCFQGGIEDFSWAEEFLRLYRLDPMKYTYPTINYQNLITGLGLKGLAARLTQEQQAAQHQPAPELTVNTRHREAIQTAIATAIKAGWNRAVLDQIAQKRVTHDGITKLCQTVSNAQKQKTLWAVWAAVNYAPNVRAPRLQDSPATLRPAQHPGHLARHCQLRSLATM